MKDGNDNMKKRIRFYPPKDNAFGELFLMEDDRFRLHLNERGTSWVDGFMLHPMPPPDEFEELWSLHPQDLGKINKFGKEIDTPRYQQTYNKGYRFSGMDHTPLPTPPLIQKYLDWANSTGYATLYGYTGFNEVLVNWYVDGRHGISAHKDDERDMKLGPEGESVVFSMTFQETTEDTPFHRTFRMKPDTKVLESTEEKRKLGRERVDIELMDGLVLVMGGLCQRTHTHQVPKTTKAVGRRINITFRCFK